VTSANERAFCLAVCITNFASKEEMITEILAPAIQFGDRHRSGAIGEGAIRLGAYRHLKPVGRSSTSKLTDQLTALFLSGLFV
jgi:hypothetical protein